MLVIEGKTIEVSSEFEKYNSLRKVYLELSERLSEEFFDDFIVMFNDMDELFLRFKPVAIGYMERAVDLSIRELILVGINDISDEVFIERYVQKYSKLNDDCLEVFDHYMKIVLDIEEYEEYKKTRSSGGGSVIGGGFGVEGAVKGIAIASAANLAIGAVGGILNSVADSIKKSNNKREKDLLFKSTDTRNSLQRAVFNVIFCVHYALVDAVADNSNDKVYEIVSDESAEKARSLLINIIKGRIAENEVKNILIDAIRLNPYNADIYEYWFETYGDEGQNILAVEQYFGVVNSKRNIFTDNLDSVFEAKPADESITNSETDGDTGPAENAVNEDEYFVGAHSYNSAEKANRIRYEYVKNFLESGKKIDDKADLKKILEQDKQVRKRNTLSSLIFICCVISMFIIRWYGVLAVFVFFFIDHYLSGAAHRKALKRWLVDYEEKNGL
ncbi:MAG: hypothetical protein RBR82_12115 [Pseudomonas sp.]|nr:hypothetical protein [Pseudomonas sp.]